MNLECSSFGANPMRVWLCLRIILFLPNCLPLIKSLSIVFALNLFCVLCVTLQEETQHIIKPTGHKNDYDSNKIKRKQNMTGCSINR